MWRAGSRLHHSEVSFFVSAPDSRSQSGTRLVSTAMIFKGCIPSVTSIFIIMISSVHSESSSVQRLSSRPALSQLVHPLTSSEFLQTVYGSDAKYLDSSRDEHELQRLPQARDLGQLEVLHRIFKEANHLTSIKVRSGQHISYCQVWLQLK